MKFDNVAFDFGKVSFGDERAPRRLDFDSGASVSFVFEQTSGQKTARLTLYEHGRPFHLHVLGPRQPASNVLLYHDATRAQLFRAKFLQIRHLTGLKEYFRLSELIFSLILDSI